MTAAALDTVHHPLEGLLRTLSEDAASTSALGDAFEYVADLALWSSPEFGARIRQIWRWEEWPEAQGRDLGIDRVISTVDGELWAVQAKGYSPSTNVTYSGKGGIATFLAAAGTGQFTMQLVVTSSDSIADNARKIVTRQSTPTRILDRSWLDSLDVDWPADLAELRSAVESAGRGHGPAHRALAGGRHELAPHQKAAVNDVITCLASQSEHSSDARAKLLMPCGTGKTLTCHATAEELRAKQTLVLVPSLSLLAQTMRAWQTQSQGKLRVIAVCSDESVVSGRNDDIVVDPNELLAPVTTDPATLAVFLSNESTRPTEQQWPTVVFSTYHSSAVVAAAQELIAQSSEHSFDLLVADEAHYLAGKVSRAFATALDATKVHARRRLFATATPRIISTKLKDTLAKDGRDHDVVSMDDPAVFGPVAHELRFSKALVDGLLTDYRVLVLGIDDAEVAAMVESRRILTLDSEDDTTTDAATLAAAIATYRTLTEHGARRLVSYHSRIARAENFARLLTTLPPSLIANLGTVQVSAHAVKGTMPAGKRREVLKRLTHDTTGSDRACIVANARCLTEGVDIPTLDGVIFVDPRRSRIDVIQSVGRAIRLAENKSRGLVIIPVALNRDEDVETALAGSAFSRVWDVLGALRDHDDTLAEEVDALRTDLGRRGAMGDSKLSKITLDLPIWAGRAFAESIQLKMIEHTTSSFLYNLGLLQAFVAREGHARVIKGHVEAGIRLGDWVATQRANKDRLIPERRTQLESVLGWTWDPLADAWAAGLAAVHAFAEREGHARVPVNLVESGINLGQWVVVQRSTRERMTPDRRAQLEALPGWSWDARVDLWADSYAALKAFARREGHIRVSQRHIENGINLGSWTAIQRGKRDTLISERREQLETLPGWSWDPNSDAWNRSYEALKVFVDRNGHASVPNKYVEDGINLGKWVTVQRQAKDNLLPGRHTNLEALPGWSWDARAALWAEKFASLHIFVEREGHALVPRGHIEGTVKLGSWVREQRGKKDKLSDERRKQLEAVPGWSWNPYTDAWIRNFAILEKFVDREGHARVRKEHIENDIKLGSWVGEQRMNKDKLSDDRRKQLEAVPGWSWEAASDAWSEKLAILHTFADREGHARVPVDYVENGVRLGSWVRTQRKDREKMRTERRALLEAIPDWTWKSPHADAWDQSYAALQSFVEREGHARVPDRHIENTLKLGSWVREQRANRDKLSDERRQQLEALPGWTLNPFVDAWATNFAAAHAYTRREGHARIPSSHIENGINVGSWVVVQRTKKNELSDERRAQLESLPRWSWNLRADAWAQKYGALQNYAKREGHTKVPHSHIEDEIKLGSWVYGQRTKKNQLTDEQRAQLELIPEWAW